MSALPDPPVPRPDEPPAVALLREKLAGNRVVRWARRYRTPAAVLGGLVLTFKAYKWLLPWLFGFILNPAAGADAIRDHWELLAAGSGIVFVGGFLVVRFGLDWLDRLERSVDRALDSDVPVDLPGPAWAERPAGDRTAVHIPPRMG